MSSKKNNSASNVSPFPGGEKPEEFHIAFAKELQPSGLSEEEITVWNTVAPELSKAGRLKKLFVDVIAEYCRLVVRMSAARKDLDDREWTYVTNGRHGNQEKSRPEVAQLNDDWRKWRSLVSDLGLSPSAERHLKSTQGDLFGSEFDQFS